MRGVCSLSPQFLMIAGDNVHLPKNLLISVEIQGAKKGVVTSVSQTSVDILFEQEPGLAQGICDLDAVVLLIGWGRLFIGRRQIRHEC